jgi:hypothetical protein
MHLIRDPSRINPDNLPAGVDGSAYQAAPKLVVRPAQGLSAGSVEEVARQSAKAFVLGPGDEESLASGLGRYLLWDRPVVLFAGSRKEGGAPSLADLIERIQAGEPLLVDKGERYDAWRLASSADGLSPAAQRVRDALKTSGLDAEILSRPAGVLNLVRVVREEQGAGETAALARFLTTSTPDDTPLSKQLGALEQLGIKIERAETGFKVSVPEGLRTIDRNGGVASPPSQIFQTDREALTAAWNMVAGPRTNYVFRVIDESRSHWVWDRAHERWATVRGQDPEAANSAAERSLARQVEREALIREAEKGGPYYAWVDPGLGGPQDRSTPLLEMVNQIQLGATYYKPGPGVTMIPFEQTTDGHNGMPSVTRWYFRTQPPDAIEHLERVPIPDLPES